MKLSQELTQQKLQQDDLGYESLYLANSEITVRELEEIASNLSNSLEQAKQFVRDQEEELAEQIRMIVKLEAKLESASESESQLILQELVEEKEKAELLETTLVGQRNNIQQQELAYQQYKELLQKKRKEYLKNQDNNSSVAFEEQSLSSQPLENNPLFSTTNVPTFNFLSLGQEGVGKTVFLAGCYAQYSVDSVQKTSSTWYLECEDSRECQKLDNILNYIAKTGNYPPATEKVDSFCFSLKRQLHGQTSTFCHFRWWDSPGEYSDFQQPEFQQMVLDSHGCCIFIDAYRLISDDKYLDSLEPVINQLQAIAKLVDFDALPYRFVFILTKCDLLEGGAISWLQIEDKLKSLFAYLEVAGAKYRHFYSSIPLTKKGAFFSLQPKETETVAVFLWLASELQKKHNYRHQGLTLANALKSTQPSAPVTRKKTFVWQGLIVIIGLLGVGIAVWFAFNFWFVFNRSSPTAENNLMSERQIEQHKKLLKRDPNNLKTLEELTTIYLEQGELEAARPLMEKIVQQNPQALQWQLNLATLYELTENWQEAEKIYDQILREDSNHFQSLLGKAYLRSQQGDFETANYLFQQAERVAISDDLKAKVREMAQQAQRKIEEK